MAKQAKVPGIELLNGILGLVFSDEELANSSGMGLKKKKESSNKPSLDRLKIEAVQGNN